MINGISSLLQALTGSIGGGAGGAGQNKDLEDQRDQMQRKSFQRSNKVFENNEAKKNAEAVR
ncbi:MAG: hypothetical protein WBB95_03595 [Pseudomonas sp.]|uniref:hypothetical protein n=1 Tax=Pseudomonas sp. TaxID=306 RepID=UPI003C769F3F